MHTVNTDNGPCLGHAQRVGYGKVIGILGGGGVKSFAGCVGRWAEYDLTTQDIETDQEPVVDINFPHARLGQNGGAGWPD